MRLVQLVGDNIEDLYSFPDDITDNKIQELYKEYEKQEEFDSFDEFLQETTEIDATREFIDIIYI